MCITSSLIKPKDNKTLYFISSIEIDNPYGENTDYTINKNNKATNDNNKNKYSKSPKLNVNSFYNDNKLGVNIVGQMTSYGTAETWKSYGWAKKLAFNQILTNLLQNSSILYNKYNNTKISIKDFRLAIICNRMKSGANKDNKPRKHFC